MRLEAELLYSRRGRGGTGGLADRCAAAAAAAAAMTAVLGGTAVGAAAPVAGDFGLVVGSGESCPELAASPLLKMSIALRLLSSRRSTRSDNPESISSTRRLRPLWFGISSFVAGEEGPFLVPGVRASHLCDPGCEGCPAAWLSCGCGKTEGEIQHRRHRTARARQRCSSASKGPAAARLRRQSERREAPGESTSCPCA